MTTKEAIEILETKVVVTLETSEALAIAIAALEKQEKVQLSEKGATSDLIERQTVLRCIKESRENIDWGQSEDGDAFLHYSAALYRTIASKGCMPSAQPERKKGYG